MDAPTCRSLPEVISVIARDINNVDAGFANLSSCKKSVSAPGVHIRIGDTESYQSGTSFAAPFVSGTVALMKQAKPSLGVQDVQKILERASTDGNAFSSGLIRADLAVEAVLAP